MAAKKYYAVKKGKTPGIYLTWDECKMQVTGVPGAVYKGFATLEEAQAFINDEEIKFNEGSLPENYAFTDGSFNSVTGVYGYGGFLMAGEEKIILQGSDNVPSMAEMRNVAGEICGSMAAVRMALLRGIKELTIFYDYEGVRRWATGEWKTNKDGTLAYKEYMQSKMAEGIKIDFCHVKGHSGVAGNEEADRLAKQAVGIE